MMLNGNMIDEDTHKLAVQNLKSAQKKKEEKEESKEKKKKEKEAKEGKKEKKATKEGGEKKEKKEKGSETALALRPLLVQFYPFLSPEEKKKKATKVVEEVKKKELTTGSNEWCWDQYEKSQCGAPTDPDYDAATYEHSDDFLARSGNTRL